MEITDQNNKNETYTLKTSSSEATFSIFKLISLSFTTKNNNIKSTILNNTHEEKDFLLDGSYLMFPWVGRIQSNKFFENLNIKLTENFPFTESNGFALHGFLANQPRKVIEISKNSISFKISESNFTKILFNFFPEITEKYTLFENKLTLDLEFENKTEKEQFFNFGYHPYFQFDLGCINNLKIDSDFVSKKWFLDSKFLIPKIIANKNDEKNQRIGYLVEKENFKFEDYLIGKNEFDNLFEIEAKAEDLIHFIKEKKEKENDFNFNLELIKLKNDERKMEIVLSTKIPESNELLENFVFTKFIQIYSPEERNRIAIEPMSGPSNSFNFPELITYNVLIGAKQKKHSNFQISFKAHD